MFDVKVWKSIANVLCAMLFYTFLRTCRGVYMECLSSCWQDIAKRNKYQVSPRSWQAYHNPLHWVVLFFFLIGVDLAAVCIMEIQFWSVADGLAVVFSKLAQQTLVKYFICHPLHPKNLHLVNGRHCHLSMKNDMDVLQSHLTLRKLNSHGSFGSFYYPRIGVSETFNADQFWLRKIELKICLKIFAQRWFSLWSGLSTKLFKTKMRYSLK